MMKKLSKIALLAAASAFMLAVFPACGDDEDDPSVEITGGDSVTIGGTLELTAVVSDFPDVGVAYAWSSSDESVATVVADSETPSKATVTAIAEGKATITVTATVGDTVATAAIEVSVKLEGKVDEGEITFPLSITPTTTGSSPAYPTAADTEKNLPYAFTSPVAYTVCTKKKFDTGKYNTGSEIKTENRWNLGGALESSGKYNCYMKFDSAPSAKMTVKFFNTNANRTITVVSGETKNVGTVTTTTITDPDDSTKVIGNLMSETFTVTKGSEVYLGATASGIWVAEIIWEE